MPNFMNRKPVTTAKAMMRIFLAIFLLVFAGCAKTEMKITPQVYNEKIFSVEKKKIVFIRHVYQIENLEREGEKK